MESLTLVITGRRFEPSRGVELSSGRDREGSRGRACHVNPTFRVLRGHPSAAVNNRNTARLKVASVLLREETLLDDQGVKFSGGIHRCGEAAIRNTVEFHLPNIGFGASIVDGATQVTDQLVGSIGRRQQRNRDQTARSRRELWPTPNVSPGELCDEAL